MVATTHARDYMTYAYLQMARDGDARKAIDEAQQVKNFNPARFVAPYALSAMPARYAVERGDWRAAAQLEPRQDKFPHTVAMTHFARALGAARSGDPAAAQKDIERLSALLTVAATPIRVGPSRPPVTLHWSMATSSIESASRSRAPR